MIDALQHQAETHPAWEDWEDGGGFDDDDSLMGFTPCRTSKGPPQERPWYYEKKQNLCRQPVTVAIQLSAL